MTRASVHGAGSLSLGLSAVIFGIYFLNVLVGGPLDRKPWMSDVWEMLTLFVAVSFFVVGTICRESEAQDGGRGQARGE
jgi:hypothetical protein